MNRKELYQAIMQKGTYLCVGLDTDISRIPKHLLGEKDPILEFNKQIINATKDLCVAYKPNVAFYEAHGSRGWRSLERTMDLIPESHFTIADAKRGDIGNTSKMYAKAFFENMNFDAVTVAPYMGIDSVTPFLEFENKWVILLALTSNKGSRDFQFTMQEKEQPLYEKVMRRAQEWGNEENLMFVTGATQSTHIEKIRKIAPNNFLLVPGVGAQGGSLHGVSMTGLNSHGGLLVNSSRGIIYAGDGEDFAVKARKAALNIKKEMGALLNQRYVVGN